MPLYRKQYVKSVDSIDINEMPDDFTRLMWTWLPLKMDSKGRGIDDSQWIRSAIFPLRRDVTLEMIDAAMCWYTNRGMICRYEVEGRRFFEVKSFALYQGKTDRESPSVIPDPVVSKSSEKRKSRKSKSGVTHDLLMSKSSTDAGIDAGIDALGNGADKPPENQPLNSKNDKSAAVALYHTTMRLWPNTTQEAAINRVAQDLAKWQLVVDAWRMRGYSPKNVEGMLDWYRDGIPDVRPSFSKPQNTQPPTRKLRGPNE